MTEYCKTHIHMEHQLLDTSDEWIKKCPTCNKTTQQMFDDVDDYDPLTKPSQQPHGESTLYCNSCQMYVKPTYWDGENVCPYHQRTMSTEEGSVRMYDEFNDDGEEW